VFNAGNKSARDFYWGILVPYRFYRDAELELRGGALSTRPDDIARTDDEQRIVIDGYYDKPLYPRRNIKLGYALVRPTVSDDFFFEWSIQAEDGTHPSTGQFGVTKPSGSSTGGGPDWFTEREPVDELSPGG
jgi:hypothetical protein